MRPPTRSGSIALVGCDAFEVENVFFFLLHKIRKYLGVIVTYWQREFLDALIL